MGRRAAHPSLPADPRHVVGLLVRRAFQSGVALLLVAGVSPAAAQPCPAPSGIPIIGPGTACQVCWTNPTTNTDGSPITKLLTAFHFYLDPPATGPVIGATPIAFSAPIANPAAGADNATGICTRILIPTGTHTVSGSVVDADGESSGSMPPFSFRFQGIPAAAGSGVQLR
jgi:hypothetical protein